MKKTIKRGQAIEMYRQLNAFSFNKLNEEQLEAVMDNIIAIEKIDSHFTSLMQELGKRLYGEHDQEKLNEFNMKMKAATSIENIEKKVAALNTIKDKEPELFELLNKQVKIENSLREKDIEVEITELDRAEFSKAIIKANKDVAYGIFDLFEPMFKVEEKEEVEADFSELDNLLND